ncbi:FAD:protein FMN transferase [Paenibacillus sabinae]|uniref:FAD:protein FMN transferase n=1 Tax=Paenibacillus sabinae T27 TaxID=1268072 RepID=X4ZT66_9BACL|nr:FAD:protein FMN transferase [Paenibacillus sabinae]AHV99650.1 ApbE-like lipoprotein family protein [Paenibacillus sabinae T27]
MGMLRRTKLCMDTVVDIQVIVREEEGMEQAEIGMKRAFEAFRRIEQACSRFSPDSELMKACRVTGAPVQVSPFLFEPIRFAIELAEWTEGVFDPTIGKIMEKHGFNRHYLTGERVNSRSADFVTYRDIVLDERDCTLLLHKPLVIDLGAVAKGFAIDLAANELKSSPGFIINAGGDLYAGGTDEKGEPWKIGIRHPLHKEQSIQVIKVSGQAVCTSGSYERRSAKEAGMHHIINAVTESSPNDWISCTVIAPYAMQADAFSTASFLLGAEGGRSLITQAGLQGIWITPDLQIDIAGREEA